MNKELTDTETFLLISFPIWVIALVFIFTMLFKEYRAGSSFAIMIAGLFLIKIHRKEN